MGGGRTRLFRDSTAISRGRESLNNPVRTKRRLAPPTSTTAINKGERHEYQGIHSSCDLDIGVIRSVQDFQYRNTIVVCATSVIR